MYLPPFIAGMGLISPKWIIGSVAAAWLRSIITISEAGVGDYRDVPADEFMKVENNVKSVTVFRTIGIGVCYGLGFLAATLFYQ